MNAPITLVRRYLECTALVLLWIAGGFYFHLGPIAFQLLGLPLLAAFQLAVARRPLAQLWVFDAAALRLDRRTLVIAGAALVVCAALLVSGRGRVATGLETRAYFFLLLIAAAIPAAFALRRQRAADLRGAAALAVIAIVIRVGWRVGWAPTWDGPTMFAAARLPDFFADLICEFVALFLVDEVAFRGALDPHLSAAGTSRLHAWSSALFVSLLWSAWHFPLYHPHAKTFLQLMTNITPWDFLPVIYGVPLSFCARRSRTLVPSAAIHAAGNAYVLAMVK